MASWDFAKDAGKAVLDRADAAPAPTPDPARARDPEAQTLAALRAELRALNLDSEDVQLRLRADRVLIRAPAADPATLEQLILALGNIQGIAGVEADLPAAAPAPVFHTVTRGETLSTIARTHLGDAALYSAVFEANRPMLSDPDEIYAGQVLRIPVRD